MSAAAQSWLAVLCSSYVLAKVLRGSLQHLYAVRFTRAMGEDAVGEHRTEWPSVDVLVPCFREQPELLRNCLESLAKQDYKGEIKVFVVDDGPRNDHLELPVEEMEARRLPVTRMPLPANVGKRRALDAVYAVSHGDLVVTIDSDTVLMPNAIRRIVPQFADPQVGSVSATIHVLNWDTNRLTRLIERHYRLLVEKERAAQGHFRAVLCCWGGFAAYRRTALEAVWDHYLDQTIAGRRCRTGDDLHLTLELLASGYHSVLQPDAVARTFVPDTPRKLARQQLRWSRSFIRELMPWTFRAIARRSPFLFLDVIVQAVTPVLLATATLLALAQGRHGLAALAGGLSLVLATMVVTSILATLRARDPWYLLYGVVYHALILPGWLFGLVSFNRDTWITRGPA